MEKIIETPRLAEVTPLRVVPKKTAVERFRTRLLEKMDHDELVNARVLCARLRDELDTFLREEARS